MFYGDEFDTNPLHKKKRTHQGSKPPCFSTVKDVPRNEPMLTPLMSEPPRYLTNGSSQSCPTAVTATQNQANYIDILPGAVISTVGQMLSSSPSGK